MFKLVAFAFTALTVAAPALAAPAEASTAASTDSFTRDGKTYYFTQKDMGSYQLLAGHDSVGRKFEFRVAGSRVTGYYDSEYMEFSTPTPATQVASR